MLSTLWEARPRGEEGEQFYELGIRYQVLRH